MGDATKICGICAQSCAGKPRIKDTRGQYYCMECHERAMARQAILEHELVAPTRAAAPDEAIGLADDRPGGGRGDAIDALNELLPVRESPAARVFIGDRCPGCDMGIAPRSVVCVNCGYNFRGGGQVATAIEKPKTIKRARSLNFEVTPLVLFVMLAGLPILLALLDSYGGVTGIGILALIGALLVGLVGALWLVVASFMDGILHGILALLLWPYTLYWLFVRNENGHLKATVAAYVVGLFGVMGILTAGGSEFMKEFREERLRRSQSSAPFISHGEAAQHAHALNMEPQIMTW